MRSLLTMSLAFSSLTVFASWDASDYHTHSSSQKTAAQKLLAGIDLDPNAALLDVGCGPGALTFKLAQQLKGEVVGVDISSKMIDFAQATYADKDGQLSFSVADAADLKYKNRFDYVTSFSTLQWVPRQSAALKGMYEALKPGGTLLITVPRHYPECLSNALIDVTTKAPYQQRFASFTLEQVFFGVQEYNALVKEAGFTDTQVTVVRSYDRFDNVAALTNFIKQWLPWAQVFSDAAEKDAFMQKVMTRYVAYCPIADDGHVMFLKDQIETVATKPQEREL